ncbi:Guanine nucleotide-binding protein G(I)/G(S)/G(O) subunit gamma-10 [Aix galericulata]|nr:Guanine nucleotide-binding protein G(I)/G(S)/G(O) subunit gamma-10 [Aix galericulata]
MENPAATVLVFYHEDKPRGTGTPALRVPPAPHRHGLSHVSQAAAELQQYCMQNACKDALLVGVPAGSNPFREPRSCALL